MVTIQWLPFLSSAVTFLFAALVFRRYLIRRGMHLLIWGIGLTMYGLGTINEAYYSAFGWHPLVFRLWYFFGAMMAAAWLGQGTVYLLARRAWADRLLVLLILGSIFGLIRIFGAELDPSLMPAGELSGRAITSPGVRVLTPFFNIYGTVTLVGGAIYSAWLFWRKRILPHRVIGNILIAVGAMAPAFSGLLSRMGFSGYLYIGELFGAILMFLGFLRATTPVEKYASTPARGQTI